MYYCLLIFLYNNIFCIIVYLFTLRQGEGIYIWDIVYVALKGQTFQRLTTLCWYVSHNLKGCCPCKVEYLIFERILFIFLYNQKERKKY